MLLEKHKIGFKKLVIGFFIILSIALFSAIISSVVVRDNSQRIEHVNNEIYPFMESLSELSHVVLKSKMLITNWVYLQYNLEDKQELKKLIEQDYPTIKEKIALSFKSAGHQDNADIIRTIFSKMDQLLVVEKDLMNTLVDFDDYENPQKVFAAESVIEEEIIPKSKEIRLLLDDFIVHVKLDNNIIRDNMVKSLNRLEWVSIIVGFGMFIIILFSVVYIQNQITTPIINVHKILLRLSKGEVIEQKVKLTDNIISQIIEALNRVSDNFAQTANSAHKIGQGDFNEQIIPLSPNDILGNAIIEMRNSLKEYSEEMEAKVQARTEKISEQNKIIAQKNSNITASINYALRIQNASLPSLEEIHNELDDSFVLFKPKDIVSGDFYWFSKVDNKIIVAAVDCTGHGVPGSFMSLIGINLLSAIVNENKITESDQILEELHRRVQQALKQDTTSNQDGMDMALCVIDTANKTLDFTGAKNPLIYIQNNEIVKVKGDKKGIGGTQIRAGNFSKHTVSFETPTSFYIFSDGFQDQFGGENNRKFMISHLKEMFLRNHHLSMDKQQKVYDQTFKAWTASTQQTDDILIVGFKI